MVIMFQDLFQGILFTEVRLYYNVYPQWYGWPHFVNNRNRHDSIMWSFFVRFSVVIMPFFLIKSCHLVRNHEIHHKVIRDFKVVLNRPILQLTRYILFLPPLSNDVMWFSLQILYFIWSKIRKTLDKRGNFWGRINNKINLTGSQPFRCVFSHESQGLLVKVSYISLSSLGH